MRKAYQNLATCLDIILINCQKKFLTIVHDMYIYIYIYIYIHTYIHLHIFNNYIAVCDFKEQQKKLNLIH